ncbi:hypothetical protein NPIL_130711 [Nephila pilipes]|uniref:Uncharacterized protein n=1 Tax=Nephila pilipes TaxID=299642 RepID=A0A8X6TA86_NEPPI|nr:hypothetical protein NPIL_130711 [Nephila pilipes]
MRGHREITTSQTLEAGRCIDMESGCAPLGTAPSLSETDIGQGMDSDYFSYLSIFEVEGTDLGKWEVLLRGISTYKRCQIDQNMKFKVCILSSRTMFCILNSYNIFAFEF